jgi:hypothetical protein
MKMSRLFVTKDDTFTLSILYSKEGELKVSRVEAVAKEEIAKWEQFDIEFILPDFGTAKGIMRNSTDHDGGRSFLNIGMFNNAILISLARKWNLKDDDGKDIPIDMSKLNELRPDIARLFVELLAEKLQKEGLYDAILLS